MAGVFSVSVAIFQVFLVVETAGNLRGRALSWKWLLIYQPALYV